MIYANDPRQGELVEPPKRGRGRPATGTAQSAAERQKARRERIRASGGDVLTLTVDAEVAAALRKFVRFKDETQGDAVNRILRDRLLRPR